MFDFKIDQVSYINVTEPIKAYQFCGYSKGLKFFKLRIIKPFFWWWYFGALFPVPKKESSVEKDDSYIIIYNKVYEAPYVYLKFKNGAYVYKKFKSLDEAINYRDQIKAQSDDWFKKQEENNGCIRCKS